MRRTIRDGHSSGTMFAHCLEQPTRTASLTLPCGVFAFSEQPALPSLFGFAPGVVCHAASVAGGAVRSYRTFSPLPRFASQASRGGSFSVALSLGLFPLALRQNPAGCYPAPYVDGARTFLPRSLSAVAGAAVRPTDALGMGAEAAGQGVLFVIARSLATKQSSLSRRELWIASLRLAMTGNSPSVKINYPEDVVLRLARSTGCRRMAPIKRS